MPDYVLHEPVVILKPEMVHIAGGARIDAFVKLEGGQGLHIGKGVHIASFAHINIGGGKVVLGHYCAVTSGAKIVAGSNMKTGQAMSAAAPEWMQDKHRGEVVVGEFAFIGVNAVVLYDVRIGEGAVIGAGSVVTKSVPPWEIWVGNPAKKIGERERGKQM